MVSNELRKRNLVYLSLFACPKSNQKRPRQRTPHVGGLYPDLAVVLLSLEQWDLHGHFRRSSLIKGIWVGLGRLCCFADDQGCHPEDTRDLLGWSVNFWFTGKSILLRQLSFENLLELALSRGAQLIKNDAYL